MPAPSLAAITGFEQKLIVGVADLAVSSNPNVVIITYSLGSCLGVTIYDPVTKVGGLLHAMLPDSAIDPAKAASQAAMFIDTGIPALFRAAYQLKADKHRVQICLAGAAQVMDGSGFFSIGKRNYEMLMKLLGQHGLVVRAEQVGGLVSRTISLNIKTGEVRLKCSGQNLETILWKG
ncbi:MAG: chemotaxis protein CheD [Verrucomicrobia bacterium]|nr:chemotaxis protein CheD [Verrucomicrobiota bacterium]MBI3869061.1 chemotaxis protein CheD [Verrucomicrobiota bacterium]